jgi:hypothetical protein
VQGLALYLDVFASVVQHQPGRMPLALYFCKTAEELRYAGRRGVDGYI